jgi:hypothetical protein
MRSFVSTLLGFAAVTLPWPVYANPYLSKPGEAPATVRAATCAITGGFIHLYAALDSNLFDKYGVKVEFVSIRGSGVALAALAADEIQYLYCAADATIPGMASGSDAKLIASPLVGLPWVMLARKDIKRPEELKGKSIAVTRAGDLTFRLARALLKKFNLTESEVKILTVGGTGQVEPFNAMRGGIVASTKMPEFPQIPTLVQLGYKQNLLGVWSAFFAPAGVPAEVSKMLIAALEKVVKDPAVASKLGNLGMVADYVPPDKLIAEIREEHKAVEQIAKKAGLIK